jgi:hypothetical protein
MNVLDLLKALDGEIVANKARVTRNNKVEIIGRIIDNAWVMTEVGNKLALEYNSSKETKTETKKPLAKKATRKSTK